MSKCFTLTEIEQGMVKQNERDYWRVIARDQFTGLKDKHGNDIYKGDIIYNKKVGNFTVEFKHGCFGYKSPVAFTPLYAFPVSDCETIGENS